jgi:chemotaxis response regulator CheB
MIVEAQKDIEVVGEASDGREAVAQAAEVDPRRDGAPGDLTHHLRPRRVRLRGDEG